MITIRDWVATIPDADKHIAYVGEDQAQIREFILLGDDGRSYRNWNFFLDMAFDLSTVTTRDSRQVVTTQEDTTEDVFEKQVKTATTEKKESYTVENVTVNAPAKTDVAYLSKQEDTDGLYLTWTVLAQQTQLPGKLTATLRAVGPQGQVKKSAQMVFEVDPAVTATPATTIKESVFDQMMEEMGVLTQQGYDHAQTAVAAAATAQQMAADAESSRESGQEAMQEAQRCSASAREEADKAEGHALTAAAHAQTAADAVRLTQIAAATAATDAATAKESSVVAQQATGKLHYLRDVADCFVIGKNLYDPTAAHYGYILDNAGLTASEKWITTDLIPHRRVGGMCSYCFSTGNTPDPGTLRIGLYDTERQFIGGMLNSAELPITFDDTQETYDRCAYIRISFARMCTHVQIEVGDTPTAYEPYQHPFVKAEHIEADPALNGTSSHPIANKAVTGKVLELFTGLDSVRNMAVAAQTTADDAKTLAENARAEVSNLQGMTQNHILPRLGDLEAAVGDAEAALDAIIAMQNHLIGGGGV